jgi:ABC-type lipoprotein release transport system permease subunit
MKIYDTKDLDTIIKDNFADDNIDKDALSKRIEKSIKIGTKQFENGEYMSLEELQKRIKNEFFDDK